MKILLLIPWVIIPVACSPSESTIQTANANPDAAASIKEL
jgi:hypothetical protein